MYTWFVFILRWWIAPLLLVAATFGGTGLRVATIALVIMHTLRQVLVEVFRPEPSGSDGLRIVFAGDSFAPKIDGVATRTGKGARCAHCLRHS
jgi:hypothetical protein